MIQEHQIRILPEQAANEQNIKLFISKDKGLDARTIQAIRVLKRSIDARQRTIFVNLKVRVYINELPQDEEFVRTEYKNVEDKPQVIVVGAGPGGLFAALRLIELGLRPIVVERGKNVRDRKVDIAKISREHKVDPESNYSFGEGGAGAYSDGKLYTRSKKRGNVEKILRVFCQHGAKTDILCDAHPHIGLGVGAVHVHRHTLCRIERAKLRADKHHRKSDLFVPIVGIGLEFAHLNVRIAHRSAVVLFFDVTDDPRVKRIEPAVVEKSVFLKHINGKIGIFSSG